MPSTKDRLEALENLLLFTGGAVAGRVGPRAIVRGGARVAGAHPYALAATLAAEGWIHREEIADVASALGHQFEGTEPAGVRPAIVGREAIPAVRKVKRKVSKANRAVKHAMKILKSGTKAQTGSAPGTLPAGAFKTSTKAAGLANPKTKSIIGKGKSKVKALARKLKKWW
jgi:hypothetical protein